jgi:hypothetical protein
MSTIMALIAAVGVMPVYISSRPKKRSMRLKSSMSLSLLEPASLAAWEPWGQNMLHKGTMKDTDQEKNADASKDRISRWECLKVNVRAGILHERKS